MHPLQFPKLSTGIGRSLVVLATFLFSASMAYSQTPSVSTGFVEGWAIVDLGVLPGGTSSYAHGINEAGDVTGQSGNTASSRGFIYSNGVLTELGTLGAPVSEGSGINRKGIVAGYSFIDVAGYEYHAAEFTKGTIKDLGTLGGLKSRATAINDAGDIVGMSTLAGETQQHAFLYTKNQMTDLGTLGGSGSVAFAINKTGRIAGYSYLQGDAVWHAVTFQKGAIVDIGTLGGAHSDARAINDNGDVVGNSETATGEHHGFLYSGGIMRDLGTLGGNYTTALGLNNNGKVVGQSYGNDGEGYAFMYENNQMQNLSDLAVVRTAGWTLLQVATAINDKGQIAGTGLINGQYHGFLLTPALNPKGGRRP